MKSINSILLVTGALLVALMFVLPGAVAQSVNVDPSKTTNSVGPIRPELDTGDVTLAFFYDYNTGAHSLAGFQKATTTATLDLRCDPNIVISGAQAVAIDLAFGTNADARKPFQFDLGIGVTRDLPGLRTTPCTYSVTTDAVFAPTIDEAQGGNGVLQVRADYYALIQARVGQQIKQAGPQKDVPFEIQVENFGNARTTVQFSIEERPGSGNWVAALPDDLILSSPTNPITATTGTAVFTITTAYKNGWNNEQGLYRVKMSSFASDDPEKKGTDVNTNVIVRVRGVYVPGLEPVVMLGAVLGTALLARAKRLGADDESDDEDA